mmetsp:Transcript_96374/g.215797  ORF Transcript_96374/g.215797 Transcript_96374/m.215797 type:complete len:226 (-) Transcript_96374:65-742(-)
MARHRREPPACLALLDLSLHAVLIGVETLADIRADHRDAVEGGLLGRRIESMPLGSLLGGIIDCVCGANCVRVEKELGELHHMVEALREVLSLRGVAQRCRGTKELRELPLQNARRQWDGGADGPHARVHGLLEIRHRPHRRPGHAFEARRRRRERKWHARDHGALLTRAASKRVRSSGGGHEAGRLRAQDTAQRSRRPRARLALALRRCNCLITTTPMKCSLHL